MIQLRDYQHQAIAELRTALKEKHSSAVLVLPTGAGKTTVAAQLTKLMVEREAKVWFVAHSVELVAQARARMEAFGLKVGCIAAGWQYHPQRRVQCCMIQSLSRRVEQMPDHEKPDFLFFDESQHVAAASYVRVIDACPRARRIGLTATPFRVDGKGLGQWYDSLIAPVSVADLMAQGHLVRAKYYATPADLEGLALRGGEYAVEETYRRFDKRSLYAGVVINYLNFAAGKKAIVFCVNVDHSLKTAQAFNDKGVSAAHLDGTTPAATRARVLADFAAGKYDVLTSVSLFLEGFDLPSIEAIIFNRPTKSKALWLQGIGRGLRPAPGKSHAIIIDHGSNLAAHGFADDEQEYSLEDVVKKKKKGTALDVSPIKFCPTCALINRAMARTCEECGYVWPDAISKAVAADFVEITRTTAVIGGLTVSTVRGTKFKAVPPHLDGVSEYDWTEQDWVAVGRLSGYKPGWQKHRGAWVKNFGQAQRAEGSVAA